MARPKAKKRDNDYWLRRLKRDHPALHARCLAGELPVRRACAEVGYISLPGPVDVLIRTWRKATEAQRREFFELAQADKLRAASGTPRLKVGRDGKLTLASIKILNDIISAKKLKPGAVMKAMGYSPLNINLSRALEKSLSVEPEFLGQLEAWVAKSGR
jgi:hypothetical protein